VFFFLVTSLVGVGNNFLAVATLDFPFSCYVMFCSPATLVPCFCQALCFHMAVVSDTGIQDAKGIACLLDFHCSDCSTIEEVIAKYAQLTPQERAKRYLLFIYLSSY
jgi:hypothetical protein